MSKLISLDDLSITALCLIREELKDLDVTVDCIHGYDRDVLCSKNFLTHFLKKIHANKLSSDVLLKICSNVSNKYFVNNIIVDRKARAERIKGITFLSRSFKDDMNYVLIKDLKVPYALMSDIDILVNGPIEIVKATRILEKIGCELYNFRLLAHPFKVMVTGCREGSFQIDLYPYPMWIRRQVASNEEVFQVKASSEMYGVKVPVPGSPMDFYLIATHAWFHLKLSLAEALHLFQVSKNLKESEWFYIMKVAEEWGTLDSIYVTSLILNALSSSLYGYQVVPEDIMHELERLYKASNSAKKWLKSMQRLEFPVRFPAHLAVLNSSIYTFRVLWKKSLRTAIYGVLSIYLNYSAGKLLGGEND
uniref:Nucleotidyltransferase family protein n=1 Tax=Ignisphaera aggregans TaxID=334771 RepID=A0A7J3YU54_9CREN